MLAMHATNIIFSVDKVDMTCYSDQYLSKKKNGNEYSLLCGLSIRSHHDYFPAFQPKKNCRNCRKMIGNYL